MTTKDTNATGVTTCPLVPMNIVGPDDIRTSLQNSRRFQPVLSMLLTEARILGVPVPVHVRACTVIKGTPHTKGLKLKAPDSHSVQLTWHEDSNDRCILFRISTPHGFEEHTAFDAVLRDALRRIKEKRESKAAAPQAGSPQEPPKAPDDGSAPPPSTGMDETMAALLVVALVEQGYVINSNMVAKVRVPVVLITTLGFAKENVSAAINWLRTNEHIGDSDSADFYLIHERHKENLVPRPKSELPPAAAAPSPASTAPVEPAPVPALEPSAAAAEEEDTGLGRGPNAALRKAMSGLPNLARLLQSAERATDLRARLARLAEKRAPLQTRIDELDTEKAEIVTELNTLAADVALLKQFEKQLKTGA